MPFTNPDFVDSFNKHILGRGKDKENNIEVPKFETQEELLQWLNNLQQETININKQKEQ